MAVETSLMIVLAAIAGLLVGMGVGIVLERRRWNDTVGFLRKKQEEKE